MGRRMRTTSWALASKPTKRTGHIGMAGWPATIAAADERLRGDDQSRAADRVGRHHGRADAVPDLPAAKAADLDRHRRLHRDRPLGAGEPAAPPHEARD